METRILSIRERLKPDIPWICKHRILHRDPTYWEEKGVIEFIHNSSGNLFIDIGSNRGFYSKLAKKRFKRVVSVEPDPKWKYNRPLRFVISNHKGMVHTYNNSLNNFMTLEREFHVLGERIETRQGPDRWAVTFDDLELDADLVKIDVDGAEFDVLEGMRKHLPRKMIVELHDERRAEELCNIMIEKGYDVHMLSGYHYLGERLA